MNEARHPRPDIPKRSPGTTTQGQHFKEIELGSSERVLGDGRPCLWQDWLDSDLGMSFRTFFYAVSGIENWTPEEHSRYLLGNGFPLAKGDLGIKKMTDRSGAEVWSVTAVGEPK